jgi:hypothetical protein
MYGRRDAMAAVAVMTQPRAPGPWAILGSRLAANGPTQPLSLEP